MYGFMPIVVEKYQSFAVLFRFISNNFAVGTNCETDVKE
jgi:hypothetical protein